jgi:acyl-CoA thioester hydrolase
VKITVHEHLEGFPVVMELPVVWGEMDAFGHVNNIVYFRYFESARLLYFERIGFLKTMQTTGVGPILASASCDFKKALTFPDKIHVGSRVTEMSEDRFRMQYRIVSEKLHKLAAEGEGLIVSFNYREGRKAAVPSEIRQKIESLEGRSFS